MERQRYNHFRIDPVKQQVAYINGIGRNRLHDWDEFAAQTILNRFTKDLRQYGLNDEEVFYKLFEIVNPYTKSVKNWNAWTSQVEAWIKEIGTWVRDEEYSLDNTDYFTRPEQTLEEKLAAEREKINNNLIFLSYIGKAFPEFDESSFKVKYYELVISFLNLIKDDYVSKTKSRWDDDYIFDHYSFSPMFDEFESFDFESDEPIVLLTVLSDKAMFIILESLETLDYPTLKMDKDQTSSIVNSHLEYFENLLAVSDSTK